MSKTTNEATKEPKEIDPYLTYDKKLNEQENRLRSFVECAYIAYQEKDVDTYKLLIEEFKAEEEDYYGKLPYSPYNEDEIECAVRCKFSQSLLDNLEIRKLEYKKSKCVEKEILLESLTMNALEAHNEQRINDYNSFMMEFRNESTEYLVDMNSDDDDELDTRSDYCVSLIVNLEKMLQTDQKDQNN